MPGPTRIHPNSPYFNPNSPHFQRHFKVVGASSSIQATLSEEASDTWDFATPAMALPESRGSYENPILVKLPKDGSDLVCLIELTAVTILR